MSGEPGNTIQGSTKERGRPARACCLKRHGHPAHAKQTAPFATYPDSLGRPAREHDRWWAGCPRSVHQHGKTGATETPFSRGASAVRRGRLVLGNLFCLALLTLQAADPDVREGESAAAAARPLAALFGASDVDVFRKAVSGISGLQIFEGLPDPQTESALFTRESLRSDVIEFGDFHFYKDPLPIGEEERLELRAIFHPGNPFSPGGGQDPCGRFHPDYLLVWTSGEDTYSALVGLGCQEIEARGPKLHIHRYIPPESYGRLNRILGKLTVNRPSPPR